MLKSSSHLYSSTYKWTLTKSSLACQCRGCFFLFFKDFCLKNGRMPCEQILRYYIWYYIF